ncbi:alpha-ketoacid dehydrogenase subunit beta [Actinosynnema sp. NPDC047251]|uniref:Branched-chain alpha keto acid dehydrogenase, E1 beta subunit n=1 Tax=Saccharothrix espanaensis (strain ATCC 51144 / DSM 44229 / JCM 9112 / NBRC 15066 / NRRL 15764) TaxID=1179773 RepID=K0K2V9_SACES|nr:alpha-ketoacid dehydrogenase subunit beta [Saccharothrix espanaensis]CCH31204.1 Branched-chain alpha keto acid dehydrogenase, E1 beta subunit [Saccharothrix espanaensis DSM 44229]
MTAAIGLGKAINEGLRRALADDPSVLVMGEDVGALGGVFRVTDGLQGEFGPDRVVDTPLGESGIVGTAIGLALRGFRPVCEIQFDGFVFPAFSQITSQLAKMRSRSRGRLELPVVIRIPYGGGIGAAEHHGESPEAYFTHTGGLRVVTCSNPADAYAMVRRAVDCPDPVVFFEPKRRYWDKGPVTLDEPVDAGVDRATVVRDGTDVTLLTYGPSVSTCLLAAEADEERSIQVVDLRSLNPLDEETVVAAVRSTGRCVVVHEAPVFGGYGAELAARVTERCFGVLSAPVLRVGGFAVPYPPSRLEEHYLPDLDRILDAVDRTFRW